MSASAIAADELRAAIRGLGVDGGAVCVHASLRSFGSRIEGGPQALVDAFLAEGCTLMTPAFSQAMAVSPPPDQRPARNGWDYAWCSEWQREAPIFTPASSEIDERDMGALAAAVVRHPARERGDHPLNSFAALGPLARALVSRQRPLDVYAPLRALADAGGWVVLIGVDLASLTLLHAAEEHAGRTQFRRWAKGRDGRTIQVQVGSCSSGFAAFEPQLSPLAREHRVGVSRWRAFPAAPTIAIAAAAIRAAPTLTVCADSGCARCRDAVLGGPLL